MAIPDLGALSRVPLVNDAAGQPGQLGILVRDLDAALYLWGAQHHVSPGWHVGTYDAAKFKSATYRGEPGTFSMKVALGGMHPNVELIEPLSGPSVYDEWLESRGPGLHHVGWYVPDVHASIAAMVAAGFDVVQSGFGGRPDGTGGFAYFDTVDLFGFMLEAIQARA